jgi:glucose/arabinose dehydrogenase
LYAPRILSLALAAAVVSAGAAPAGAADAMPKVPSGFTIQRIAQIKGARELTVTPNGDLIVGTQQNNVSIVPNAEGTPAAPKTFTTVPDSHAAGVFLTRHTLYIGSQFGVYRLPYHTGDRKASAKPVKIARVRTSNIVSDHFTTTVAFSKGTLYASVGSPCDICNPGDMKAFDKTRATIEAMTPNGKNMHLRATEIRNAVALAIQPGSGDLWAALESADALPKGHPYETFDDVSSHPGVPNYGWHTCYENHVSINGAKCGNDVIAMGALPAYDSPIGMVFYPSNETGKYAFPAAYRGGAFIALHGSWHTPLVPPRVAFVPFTGSRPAKTVNWNNPNTQWSEFLTGCQNADSSRICRPTGIAVGTDGSLFVADDFDNNNYRIRPSR